eukprot:g10416.t1
MGPKGLGYYLDAKQGTKSFWAEAIAQLPETWREAPFREARVQSDACRGVHAEKGCGVGMAHSAFGLVVETVDEVPGQDLQPGEVIVSIEGRVLASLSAPQMQASFQKRRLDGAKLLVGNHTQVKELSQRDPNIIQMWDPLKKAWARARARLSVLWCSHTASHALREESMADVRQSDRLHDGTCRRYRKQRRLQAVPLLLLGGSSAFLVKPPQLRGTPHLPRARAIPRLVSVEDLAVALPAALATDKVARTWLPGGGCDVINDELTMVQEALEDDHFFKCDLELEDGKISEGMKVLNPRSEIQEGKLPFTLRFYQSSRPAWMKSTHVSHWLRTMDLIRAIILRAQGPVLFWGWSTLTVSALASLFSQMWSRKEIAMYRTCLERFVVVPSWTALAWRGAQIRAQLVRPCKRCGKPHGFWRKVHGFLHRLVRLWGQRVSRGRAEISDVMGMQSSLREARINALQTLMKAIVWASYLFAVFWHAGVRISQLLLIPGTTAVVIGWVGREIAANMISGDWISLNGEDIDGWVQDVGTFYTKVVQWDKRPIYVPNAKLMSLNVQNNSRMTHRRIKYDLRLRLQDIPKIPTITTAARTLQRGGLWGTKEMINEHEDIDNVQHRLVRWRAVGEFSADVWLSCYTKPSIEGIRLKSYTATQQSVLERCSQIVYKHDAAFASSNDRTQYPAGQKPEGIGQLFKDTFNTARESQLESREEVLRQREKDIKEVERELEQKGEETSRGADIASKRELLAKEMMEMQAMEKNKKEAEKPPADKQTVDTEQEEAHSLLDVEVVESPLHVSGGVQEETPGAEKETKEVSGASHTDETSKAAKGAKKDHEAQPGPPSTIDHEEEEEPTLSPEETSDTLAAVKTGDKEDEAERRRIPRKRWRNWNEGGRGGYTEQFFERYKNVRMEEPKKEKYDKRMKGSVGPGPGMEYMARWTGSKNSFN